MRSILAISGSTRKNSSNECMLRAIAAMYSRQLNLELYTGIGELPHFNPDATSGELPQPVQELLTKIEQADGVLICTPEYVFSLPGSLKNALEWTVATTVFSYKPVAFIVAAASGQKAFESLDLILSTLIQVPVKATSKLLIQGGQGKIDADGNFLEEGIKQAAMALVESLVQEIKETKDSR